MATALYSMVVCTALKPNGLATNYELRCSPEN